ncbi:MULTISPECIES: hypothetical protein [Streptomyces]|uniref:DUF8094 domain-containing protein n=1 Tax=Streptomyces ramulosus TaxID=47762 RepID=A0ABW1FL96_9ACTN
MTKADAAKALKQFTNGFNKANRTLDPAVTPSYESDALLTIDRAGLKASRAANPQGNPNARPLTFSDPHFTVPKQAGWPRFFLADAVTNRQDRRGQDARWFLVFSRSAPDAPWRAVYLASLAGDQVPRFRTDADGFAEPVPGDGSGLVVDPAGLSKAYTDYLRTGKGDLFAPGPRTDAWRRDRDAKSRTLGSQIQYVDQPARFAPVALRTADGGALVFFASYYHQQKTVSEGSMMQVSPQVQGVMDKPVEQAQKITLTNLSAQVVKVPAKSAGGKVAVLNYIESRTSAKVP